MTVATTLIEKIQRRGWTETSSGCWEWGGTTTPKGYGVLHLTGGKKLAHRAAYEAWVGSIPAGLFVRHKCDNRSCINPDHLETGTAAQNSRDMRDRGRFPSGENHWWSKLSEDKAKEIREEYAKGRLQREIAADYGVSQTLISAVVRGKVW